MKSHVRKLEISVKAEAKVWKTGKRRQTVGLGSSLSKYGAPFHKEKFKE
jgi:hypothetical protein